MRRVKLPCSVERQRLGLVRLPFRHIRVVLLYSGALCLNRTDDLLITSEALLPTELKGQLLRLLVWCPLSESNGRLPRYECGTLPTELKGPMLLGKNGAHCLIRTDDLRVTRAALLPTELSGHDTFLNERGQIDALALGYWCVRVGLNHRHPVLQTGALPTELQTQKPSVCAESARTNVQKMHSAKWTDLVLMTVRLGGLVSVFPLPKQSSQALPPARLVLWTPALRACKTGALGRGRTGTGCPTTPSK